MMKSIPLRRPTLFVGRSFPDIRITTRRQQTLFSGMQSQYKAREEEYHAIPLRRPTLFARRSVPGHNLPKTDTFSGIQVHYKAREGDYTAIPLRQPTHYLQCSTSTV